MTPTHALAVLLILIAIGYLSALLYAALNAVEEGCPVEYRAAGRFENASLALFAFGVFALLALGGDR